MGNYTNGKKSNIIGFATLVIMLITTIALIYLQWS